MRWGQPVGPCPICGAEHSACAPSASSGPILIPQVPSRDAMTATVRDIALDGAEPEPRAEPTSITTGTYRRRKSS